MSQVTLQATQDAMSELIQQGFRPNGKLAFWNAALSVRQRLDRNCLQADVMRNYVDRPLPVNRDELRSQLGCVLTRTLNTLYEIEKLWNVGIIHFNCGSTFEEQARWRDSMCAAIPGMGLKTVSFALHIYNPASCLILTIDCWHIRRIFGMGTDESLRRPQYLALEAEIKEDITAMAESEGHGYWLITYAACLWERTRQHYGASTCKNGEYQSHASMSCYV